MANGTPVLPPSRPGPPRGAAQVQLRDKQLPCLETYFQQMLAQLLPRFLQILTMHADRSGPLRWHAGCLAG